MALNSLPPRWRKPARIGLWTLGSLLGLVLVLLLFIALFDWNAARGPIARFASARLHREVRLDGPLTVHVFSRTPSVEVRDLRIGNPDWLPQDRLADIPRLQVAIVASQLLLLRLVLDRVEVDQPQVNLVQDKSGRANWQFDTQAGSDSTGAHIPAIKRFTLMGGTLTVDDQVHAIRFKGEVVAAESGRADIAEPFTLQGNGEFNGEAFKLVFTGGALLNIRIGEPYEFQATVTAGATKADLRGSIDKPFDLGRFDAILDASGNNLADLYYLTGLSLPRTPRYQIAVKMRRDTTHYAISDINGKVGETDVHGTAAVDLKHERPLLTAKIESKSLRLIDLGVAFGASAGDKESAFLLPDTPFELNRLQQMDADVAFHASAVQTQKVPLTGVSIKVLLNDGVLRLDPVVFTLPQGKLSGQARVNTREQPTAVDIDVRLSDVQLDQFKKKGADQAPLQGKLLSHATLQGRGDSVHAVAASGNGRITAVISHGSVRSALAELTGINVLKGLGLLLSKADDQTPVRCGVAEFNIGNGTAQSNRIVFDTEHVVIDGGGRIEFKDESLHLDFTGKPKEVRLVRLRAPINVRGTLEKPSIGIDAVSAAGQGGVAAALGAVLTPLAAALAFVDPGLAQDADCAALLAEADQRK